MEHRPTRGRYDYSRVACCYEAIAALYSGGAIARSKASQVERFRPGDRVLYVGVGAGEDALLAARRGVELTCVDVSGAMLERLRARLAREALTARLIRADVFDFTPSEGQDAVVANYFLNIFDEAMLVDVLKRLRSFIDPGGHLMIADFAPPSDSRFQRILYACNYRPVNVAAFAVGLGALHPIHDHARHLEGLGLAMVERRRERWLGFGPAYYESLIARAP